MHNKQKALSLLMAAAMVLTMLPVSALAEEPAVPVGDPTVVGSPETSGVSGGLAAPEENVAGDAEAEAPEVPDAETAPQAAPAALETDAAAEAQAAGKAAVYLSNSGQDNNLGDVSTPVGTLAKAYELVQAGGTIYVMNEVDVGAQLKVEKAVTISGTAYSGASLKATGDLKGSGASDGVVGMFYVTTTTDPLTLTDIKLDGGGRSNLFRLWDNARLTLGGVTLTGVPADSDTYGIASRPGAAITVNGAITVDCKMLIAGGTYKRAGGFTGTLLAVTSSGNLTMTGVTLDGGAVYTRTANTAEGMGLANNNTGIAATAPLISVASSATLTVTNSTLEKNSRLGSNTNGGAIQNNGGTVTMTDSTIQFCQASAGGSAIYSTGGGSVTLANSSLNNNACTSGDGTLLLAGGTQAKMTGGAISDNYAKNMASGVKVSDTSGKFTLNSGTISGNVTQDLQGGGIVVGNSNTFEMKGGTISGNTAGTIGGGVYIYSGTFTMSGGTISGNTAAKEGGGVYIYNGTFTMSDGTISGNTAGTSGGGIYVSGTSTFTMTGGTIGGANPPAADGDKAAMGNTAVKGGGIYVAGGTVNLKKGTIQGNAGTGTENAFAGGGVTVMGGAVTIGDGAGTADMVIQGNKAFDGAGVMIGNDTTGSGTVNIKSDAAISGNSGTYGAGVYDAKAAAVTIDGAAITGNTASKSGAGLMLYDTTAVTLAGKVTISGNERLKAGNTALGAAGNSKDNVQLNNATAKINLAAALDPAASVGVHTAAANNAHNNQTLVTAANAEDAAASKACFFDDAGTRKIVQDSGNADKLKTLVWGGSAVEQEVTLAGDGKAQITVSPVQAGLYYAIKDKDGKVYNLTGVEIPGGTNVDAGWATKQGEATKLTFRGLDPVKGPYKVLFTATGAQTTTVALTAASTLPSVGFYYVDGKNNTVAADGSRANPYATIKEAYDAIGGAGVICVLNDLTGAGDGNVKTERVEMNADKNVVLRSDGNSRFTVKFAPTRDSANSTDSAVAADYHGLLEVTKGKVTLENITLDANQKAVCATVVNGGELILGGGAKLTGSNGEDSRVAGALFLYAGAATMKDGAEISGNTAKWGPAVTLGLAGGTGTFYMEGGNITGNRSTNTSANDGGVICGWGSRMVMSGGTITGNETKGSGGAIQVFKKANGDNAANPTLKLTGGAITNNHANNYGGAIHATGGTTIVVEGAPRITGNTANKTAGNAATEMIPSNVYLATNQVLTVGGSHLDPDAVIGVYTQVAPTAIEADAGNGVAGGDVKIAVKATGADRVRFQSDNAKQAGIIYCDGSTAATDEPITSAGHTHGADAGDVYLSFFARYVVPMEGKLNADGAHMDLTVGGLKPDKHYALLDKDGNPVTGNVTGGSPAGNGWIDPTGDTLTFKGLDLSKGPYQVVEENPDGTVAAPDAGEDIKVGGTAGGAYYVAGEADNTDPDGTWAAGKDPSTTADPADGDGTYAKPFATIGFAYGQLVKNGVQIGIIRVLNDVTLTAGAATVTGTDVIVRGENDNVTAKRDTTYTGVLLNVNGGALTLQNLTLDGGAVYSNTANTAAAMGTAETNTGVKAVGEMIRVGANMALNVESCVLQNNSREGGSTNGGAIASSGRVTLKNSTVQYCRVATSGSAIHCAGGTLKLEDSTLAHNANLSSQGAINLAGNTACIMTDSHIKDNYSAWMSPAVNHASTATFTMDGGSITGNTIGRVLSNTIGIGALSGGSGNITLKGSAVIKGNTDKDGKPADIYFAEDSTLFAAGLTDGAWIGATGGLPPAIGNDQPITNDTAAMKYFFSDYPQQYGVKLGVDGKVYLGVDAKMTITAGEEVTADGKTSIVISPADPGKDYWAVGPAPDNEKVGPGVSDGKGGVIISGLDPEKEYTVVSVPGGTAQDNVSAGGGTAIVPPPKPVVPPKQDGDNLVYAHNPAENGDSKREMNNPSNDDGKDKITIKAEGGYSYAVRDKDGKYYKPGPNGGGVNSPNAATPAWKEDAAAGSEIVFDDLPFGQDYEIVKVKDGKEADFSDPTKNVIPSVTEVPTLPPVVRKDQMETALQGDGNASLTIKDTNPNKNYVVVDPVTKKVVAVAVGTGGDVTVPNLKPGTKYQVLTQDKTVTGDAKYEVGDTLTEDNLKRATETVTALPEAGDGITFEKDPNPAHANKVQIVIDPSSDDVKYVLTDSSGKVVAVKPGNGGELVFDNLDPDKEYHVSVVDKNASGPAVDSSITLADTPNSTAKTPTAAALAAADALTGKTVETTTTTLTVKGVTGPLDTALEYVVVGPDGKTHVGAIVNGDLVFENLNPGTKYDVGVRVKATGSILKSSLTGTTKASGGNNSSSGGGGASTTVKADKTENGKVKVDKPGANAGQTVTITVTPDPGFELDKLTVKDKKGNELELKDLGNGKYSFVMPKDKPVTVDATFKETGATGDPNTNGVSKLLIVDDHIAFMKGDEQGSFRPNGSITRAETAQMFYNLLKEKNVSGNKSFSDVPANAWYAAAVHALANLGIVEGVGEGVFEPDRAISRAEFVTVAMRFATHVTGEKTFTDVDEDHWAHGFITGAAYYGWINGYEDGSFKPTNPIARAEAATVVNNMLNREGDKSFIDKAEDLNFFPDVSKDYWAFYEIVEATNAHDFTRDKDGVESWGK